MCGIIPCLRQTVCLSLCLSVCLSVYVSACLFLYLQVSLSLSLSLCLPLSLFVSLSVCLSPCLSFSLSQSFYFSHILFSQKATFCIFVNVCVKITNKNDFLSPFSLKYHPKKFSSQLWRNSVYEIHGIPRNLRTSLYKYMNLSILSLYWDGRPVHVQIATVNTH